MQKALYIFSVLFLLCFSSNVYAQTSAADYKKINKELSQVETHLKSEKITFDDTVSYIKLLNKVQREVNDAKMRDDQTLNLVQKRIDALGKAPEEGQKEAKDIAIKRADFGSEASALKAKIAEAELISAKTDELGNLILKVRNKDLLGNLLAKQDLLTSINGLWRASVDFVGFVYEIVKSPISWYQSLTEKEILGVRSNLIYGSLIMIMALFVGVYLSSFIRYRFGYKQSIDNPDYSQKVFAALWSMIAYGVIPAAIIGGFLIWLKNMPLLKDGNFGLILTKSAYCLLYIFLSQAIVKVVFATNKSKWRLVEVNDNKANSLSHALLFSIVIIGLASFLETIAVQTNVKPEIVYFIKIISNVVKMFCIVLLSKRSLYDMENSNDEVVVKKDADETIDDEQSENYEDENVIELTTSSKLSLMISFFAVIVFIISLFGYISLSEFILNRFISSILIIGLFYIINKVIRVSFHRVLRFRFWTRDLRFAHRTLVKADFWFGFVLTPIIFIIATLTLLSAWDISVDILIRNVRKFLTEFYIGGVRISIASILLGIVVFFVTLAVFKNLKKSLLGGVLAKIDMDEGVRGSLAAGFGFIGFIVSILFAIVVMGGNLTNLALIAGALSFGIGLGLQNIVSNFVSGIIILFERPMKIGDWVNISGQEGIVKQINIRATEIETFDKSSIIIPNATILSSSFTNLTHHNKLGRLIVAVGVSYNSDIKKVKEILLKIANDHKKVLFNPEPFVIITNFGDSSIDFEVRCFTSDVMNRLFIQNDIREEIVAKFREADVEIPFPQRVIHTAIV